MCFETPSDFYFRLDRKKIRSRHERELMCGKCVYPHVLELVVWTTSAPLAHAQLVSLHSKLKWVSNQGFMLSCSTCR